MNTIREALARPGRSERAVRAPSYSDVGRQAVAALALVSIVWATTSHCSSAESKPDLLSTCGDGKVAAEGGDFTQAAQEAGAQADANPTTDYLYIGGQLADAAETPQNPDGLAYAGRSVQVWVNATGEVVAFGHGACPEPYVLPGS